MIKIDFTLAKVGWKKEVYKVVCGVLFLFNTLNGHYSIAQVVTFPPENGVPLHPTKELITDGEELRVSLRIEQLRKEFMAQLGIPASDTSAFIEYLQETEMNEANNFFQRASKGDINAGNIHLYKDELKIIYSSAYQQFNKNNSAIRSNLRISGKGNDEILILNGPCTNMGFEENNFNGWTGSVQKRPANLPNPPQSFAQHCIMRPTMSDPMVPSLPVVPPGKNYSVRVGNTASGGNIVKLRQSFRVMPDSSNLIFSYSYAVVLEDPANDDSHTGLNRPHFIAKLFDQNNMEISCAEYTVVVEDTLSDFKHACVTESRAAELVNNNRGCPSDAFGTDNTDINTPQSSYITTAKGNCNGLERATASNQPGLREIYFKPWSTIAIPLINYIGQNVTIEFTAADCTPGGHKGYAYVSSNCMPLKMAPTLAICPGISTETLKGPDGFKSYNWSGPAGGISGASNTQSVVATIPGTYTLTLRPISDKECPLDIKYVIRESCTPHTYKDTLCETTLGSNTASNVNLTTYNAMVTASVASSKVTSWHTGSPANSGNKIANPASYTVKDGQKVFALIAYPSIGGETAELSFFLNKIPTIVFPDVAPICVGGATFQISGVTPANGIFFGTNVTPSGMFTPSTADTFDISYRYTSPEGCSDTITKPVAVVPKPEVDAGPDQTFCAKTPTVKLGGTLKNGSGIQWVGGSGSFTSRNDLNATYTPTTSEIANKEIILTLISAGPMICKADSDDVKISFIPLPTVDAGPDQTVCANVPDITLNGAVSGVGIGGSWSNGVGNFVNGKDVLNTPYKPSSSEISSGKVDLILTVTNIGDCPPVKDTMRLLISPLPVVELGPDITDCDNISGNLQVASLAGVQYTWSKDNSALPNSGNTLSYKINGFTTTYKVVTVNANNCKYADSIKVMGIPIPQITVRDTSVCEKESASLIAHPSNINNPFGLTPTYEWKKEGVILNSKNTELKVTQPGAYTIKINLGKCSSEKTANVYYYPLPTPYLDDLKIVCFDTVKSVDLDAGPGVKYSWEPNSETTRSISATSAIRYEVTVTNENKCVMRDAIQLKEVCPPRLFISNSFSPNVDGTNDTYNVYGAHFTNFKMYIFNRWGEVIFESDNRNKVWDGKYMGKQMDIGVYPWIITYEGDTKEYKGPYKLVGSVTVIR